MISSHVPFVCQLSDYFIHDPSSTLLQLTTETSFTWPHVEHIMSLTFGTLVCLNQLRLSTNFKSRKQLEEINHRAGNFSAHKDLALCSFLCNVLYRLMSKQCQSNCIWDYHIQQSNYRSTIKFSLADVKKAPPRNLVHYAWRSSLPSLSQPLCSCVCVCVNVKPQELGVNYTSLLHKKTKKFPSPLYQVNTCFTWACVYAFKFLFQNHQVYQFPTSDFGGSWMIVLYWAPHATTKWTW